MTNKSGARSDLLESGSRSARTPGKGRPTPKRNRTPGPARQPHPRRALVAGAAVLLVAAGGAVLATRGGGGSSAAPAPSPQTSTEPAPTTSSAPAPAQVWRDAALIDLRPLTGLVVNLGQGINAWRTGSSSARDTAAALDRFDVSLVQAQQAIAARQPFAGAPRALTDLQLTADLYLAAVRTARVATDQPKGPLQDQLVLQFSRLRNLGDRLFDQANAELEPLLGAPRDVDGVTIVRAGEVPDWVPMKLAAGPPLATAPQPSGTPRVYETARPSSSVEAWVTAVREAGVPSAQEESTAIANAARLQLGDLAVALTAASNAIHDAADPRDERLVSTRLQLGLLVDAEATRAAEAATFLSGSDRARLIALAKALAGSGDQLWDARLGARATGFAPR